RRPPTSRRSNARGVRWDGRDENPPEGRGDRTGIPSASEVREMTGIAILSAAFALYAFVAGRLERWWISAPMVFIVVGASLGPSVAGLVDVKASSELVTAVAELTLAVLLFADASTVALRDVGSDVSIALRLLFVGLPLT